MPDSSLEHLYKLEFCWDVNLDLTNAALDFSADHREGPFSGSWTLRIERVMGLVQLDVRPTTAKVAKSYYGDKVSSAIELFWVDKKGQPHLVHRSRFAAGPFPSTKLTSKGEPSGRVAVVQARELSCDSSRWKGEADPTQHRAYRVRATFTQGPGNGEVAARQQAKATAAKLSSLPLQQLPHTVRLSFPHAHDKGAELWANADLLRRSSPYFEDLFSSNFAESKPRRSKRARPSVGGEGAAATSHPEKDFEDSDDETDAILFSSNPPQLERLAEADDLPFHNVDITQAAFSTYHAVLIYLQTGFIHFAPLASSATLRTDFLARSLEDDPCLPIPVSPKSVYRLAHLLQLEDLQKLSLEAISVSLTTSNAAHELFSSTALAYDDLRELVLDFVVSHWSVVKDTEGWKEQVRSIKTGESLEKAPVAMEVHERVEELAKQKPQVVVMALPDLTTVVKEYPFPPGKVGTADMSAQHVTHYQQLQEGYKRGQITIDEYRQLTQYIAVLNKYYIGLKQQGLPLPPEAAALYPTTR